MDRKGHNLHLAALLARVPDRQHGRGDARGGRDVVQQELDRRAPARFRLRAALRRRARPGRRRPVHCACSRVGLSPGCRYGCGVRPASWCDVGWVEVCVCLRLRIADDVCGGTSSARIGSGLIAVGNRTLFGSDTRRDQDKFGGDPVSRPVSLLPAACRAAAGGPKPAGVSKTKPSGGRVLPSIAFLQCCKHLWPAGWRSRDTHARARPPSSTAARRRRIGGSDSGRLRSPAGRLSAAPPPPCG